MKKRLLYRKILSNRGASILFAMLLFMVCSAVGIVILSAGTAASGRLSELSTTDQRYYSVTSAAELLVDLIDGKTVTVDEDANSITPTDSNLLFIRELASYYVFRVPLDGEGPDLTASPVSDDEIILKYSLTAETDSGELDQLKVKIEEVIQFRKKRVIFYIVNDEAEIGSQFALSVTFRISPTSDTENNTTDIQLRLKEISKGRAS